MNRNFRTAVKWAICLIWLFGQVPELSAQTDSTRHMEWYNRIMELTTLTEQSPQEAADQFNQLYEDYDSFSGGLKVLYLEQRSWAAYRLGNYDQCLADLRKAMDLSFANDNYQLDGIYLNLGHLYSSLDSLGQAANYYRKSIAILVSRNDSSSILSAYDGLAQYHQELEDYDSALYYMELNMAIGEASGDSSMMTSVWNNYSTVLYETGQTEKAIEYQQKAIAIEEHMADSVGLIFSYANIGRYHMGIDEVIANDYIQRSFEIARAIDAKDALIELYEGFSLLESGRGNYKEALEYFREFHNYRSELINSDMVERVKDWEITLDNQRKDEEIKFQKARTRNLIIIIAIVVTLASWIIYSNIQIRKVKAQLEKQNAKLDELNATKDKFFSIIAHDLRSPMIGLQGVGQKLEYFIRKERPEKLLEMGSKIDQSIDQLNHLLNNLLNWATSQTGGIPHHPEHFDVHAVVEENIKLYKSLSQSKEVSLINNAGHFKAYADLNTTSTIIRNLLSNAIKFTEPQSSVVIEATEQSEFIAIDITDHGPGMDKETAQSIFEETRSMTGSSGEKGFGLGLKLCKEFVEMNSGAIHVTSERGKGTTFRVKLPRNAKGILRDLEVA